MSPTRISAIPLFLCVVFVSLGLVKSTGVAAQSNVDEQAGPTLEDLFTVRQLGSVRVSPAGDAVLYTVTEADLEANERDSDIFASLRARALGTRPSIRNGPEPERVDGPLDPSPAETTCLVRVGRSLVCTLRRFDIFAVSKLRST